MEAETKIGLLDSQSFIFTDVGLNLTHFYNKMDRFFSNHRILFSNLAYLTITGYTVPLGVGCTASDGFSAPGEMTEILHGKEEVLIFFKDAISIFFPYDAISARQKKTTVNFELRNQVKTYVNIFFYEIVCTLEEK